jgi:hypothetical protein
MGTLKGGLGIMQNLSNADMPENLNDSMNQMDLALCGLGSQANGGKILNIENVLNQIQQQ